MRHKERADLTITYNFCAVCTGLTSYFVLVWVYLRALSRYNWGGWWDVTQQMTPAALGLNSIIAGGIIAVWVLGLRYVVNYADTRTARVIWTIADNTERKFPKAFSRENVEKPNSMSVDWLVVFTASRGRDRGSPDEDSYSGAAGARYNLLK